jgi:hypothetical protein
MMPLPKPDTIYTHESDLDGFLGGLLLQRLAGHLFGAAPPLQAFHNHLWRQKNLTDGSAWVCDMAFEARLDRPHWLVIDHHPPEAQPKQARLIHDLERSASKLCYDLCCAHGLGTPVLDRLVELSNIADLFLDDHPDFVQALDYANLVKIYQFWNLHTLIGGDAEQLLNHPLLEVMAVKRRVEDPLGYAWSRNNVVELGPGIGFVPMVVGNTNLIVHQLLETQATPFSSLLTLFRRGNGLMLASVRSRDGSAQRIAERLQGGGHANASGATLPRSIRSVPEAVQYLKRIFQPAPTVNPGLTNLEALLDAAVVGGKGATPPT